MLLSLVCFVVQLLSYADLTSSAPDPGLSAHLLVSPARRQSRFSSLECCAFSMHTGRLVQPSAEQQGRGGRPSLPVFMEHIQFSSYVSHEL